MSTTTPLRRVRIVGPARRKAKTPPSDSADFTWTARLSVAYMGRLRTDRSLVNSTHGMRLLLQSPKPDVGPPRDGVTVSLPTGVDVSLHGPQLLSVIAGPTPKFDATLEFPTADDYGLRPFVPLGNPNRTLGMGELVVVPQDPWPMPQGFTEIVVPTLRLAEGRLRVAVSARGGTVGAPKGFLRLVPDGAGDVFVFARKAKDPADLRNGPYMTLKRQAIDGFSGENPFVAIDLTPHGIELEATLVDPGSTLGIGGNRIEVRVRLVETPDPLAPAADRWSLELVRDPSDGIRRALRAIQAAFTAVPDAPVRLDVDAVRTPPAVRWPLVPNQGGLAVPSNSDGSLLWRMEIDRDAARARLHGIKAVGGELPTVVDVAPDRIAVEGRRVEGSTSTHVVIEADRTQKATPADQIEGARAELTWERGKPTNIAIAPRRNEDVTWLLDESALAREAVARYVEAGVHPAGKTTTFVFMPIERGWLQWPLRVDAPTIAAIANPPVAFDGTVEYVDTGTNSTVSGRRIVVSAADRVSADVEIIGGTVARMAATLYGAEGTASGLLWIATASPTPAEVLPRLRGPAALESPALTFGRGPRRDGASLRLSSRRLDWRSAFTLTLPVATPPVPLGGGFAWTAFDELPLVTAIAMTRTADSSGEPLTTRHLLPRPIAFGTERLDIDFAFDSVVPGVRVGGADVARRPPEQASWEKVPFVAVTLPGIEFATAPGGLPDLRTRLRFDLPILDELFATTRVPEKAPVARTGQVGLEPPPVDTPTTLDPDALRKAWERALDRLELSRTQAMSAFKWNAQAPPSEVDIASLFEPATWKPKFGVTYPIDLEGTTYSFGSYSLEEGSWREVFSGSSALAGLTAQFKVVGTTLRRTDGTLSIVGFAAALWDSGTAGDPLWRDTRGAATAALPQVRSLAGTTPLGAVVMRRTELTTGATTSGSWRVTLSRPIEIQTPARSGNRTLGIWFRDLPMTEPDGTGTVLEFKPGPLETGIGPRQSAFDATELPESIYEWRFVNDAKTRAEYELPIGPFVFRPLRLFGARLGRKDEKAGYGPIRVVVVGSLALRSNTAPTEEKGPFGNDRAYASGNLVAIDLKPKTDPDRLSFENARWRRIVVRAGTSEPIVDFAQKADAASPISFRLPNVRVQLGTSARTDVTTAALRLRWQETTDGSDTYIGRPADDQGRPQFVDAELTAILFGRSVTLTGGAVSYATDGSDALTVVFAATPSVRLAGTGLELEKATLRWSPNSGADGPELRLEGTLAVSVQDTRAPVRGAQLVWLGFGPAEALRLYWANLSIEGAAPVVDHAHGVLTLKVTPKPPASPAQGPAAISPIAGLDVPAATVRAELVMAFEPDPKTGASTLFRSVSGFGELLVAAPTDPTKPDQDGFRFHHQVCAPAKAPPGSQASRWQSDIRVDLKVARESRIRWPLDSVKSVDVDGLATRCTGHVMTQTLEPSAEATPGKHHVAIRVTCQHLPDSVLSTPDRVGGNHRVAIGSPWVFSAIAQHAVTFDGAERVWTSIDHLALIDAKALVESAWRETRTLSPGELRAARFAFAARYKWARIYPNDPDRLNEQAIKAGLFRRAFAPAGFPTAAMAQHLNDGTVDSNGHHVPGAFERDGIVMTGAGPMIVALGATTPGSSGPTGVVLSLPWIATLEEGYDFGRPAKGKHGKLAAFPQASAGRVAWDAPDIDWAAGDPLPISHQPPVAVGLRSAVADEIHGALARAVTNATTPDEQVARALMPVEQVFLRPPKGVKVPLPEQPRWLRSLLALCRAWKDIGDAPGKMVIDDRVSLLVASGLADGRFARIAVSLARTAPISPARTRLVAVGRSATAGDALPPDQPIGAGDAARTNARLLARAIGLVPDLVAARAVRDDEAWMQINVPSDLDDPALEIVGRNPLADRLCASPALGWPTGRGTSRAATGSIGMGPDQPLQDLGPKAVPPPTDADGDPVGRYGSGLAGRDATLSFGARAAAPSSTPGPEGIIDTRSPVFYTLGRKTIFDRPARDQVPLVTPPVRHLSPTDARIVIPTEQALKDALKTQLVPSVPARLAPIVPPHLERTTFGLRPGAMQAEFDALVFNDPPDGTPGSDDMDADFERFGRPGHAGPRLVRQQRPPRGPGLPRIPVARAKVGAESYVSSHGRRTFVALDDVDTGTPALPVPFRLFEGTATVVRRVSPGHDHSFHLRVLRDQPDGARFGEITFGKGRIDLRVTSPSYDAGSLADAVAKLGLLRDDRTVSAGMSVGEVTAPFASATWKKDGDGILITFELAVDKGPLPAMLHAIDEANGDTEALFVIRCAEDSESGNLPTEAVPFKLAPEMKDATGSLQPETRRTIVLPLAIRPGVRPTASIKTATLVFADPSYDRQLSGPGGADVQRVDDGRAWKLALDRLEYGLDTPVFFAFGKLDQATGLFEKPSGRVVVTFARRPNLGPDAKDEPLVVAERKPDAAHSGYTIDHGRAYGITLDRFRRPDGAPVAFEDGDQLTVTVVREERPWSVRARVVAKPIIAPPPAVYSLVIVDAALKRTRVALHATAPLPQRIEFPQLEMDLALGHIRRRALFEWRYAVTDLTPGATTLVKVDRAGGGQLPERKSDIRTMAP